MKYEHILDIHKGL